MMRTINIFCLCSIAIFTIAVTFADTREFYNYLLVNVVKKHTDKNIQNGRAVLKASRANEYIIVHSQ